MKKALLFLKIFFSILIFLFLCYRVYNNSDSFSTALTTYSKNYEVILLVVVLMPLNWLMEVFKWKLSIKDLVQIGYWQAIKGVLSGVALGFITPHAVGDYFAKVWSLNHIDRKKALGPILVARASQMFPTLLFGVISVKMFMSQFQIPLSFNFNANNLILLITGSVFLILLSYLFFKFGKKRLRLAYYFELVKTMKLRIIVSLFLYSFLRYMIFSIQFLILLSIFTIDLSIWNKFLGVSFMFLAKSVLPTFNFFNDLGVREFSAALYFEAMSIPSESVILAGLILWLINIALPALIGLFFVQQFKIDPV